MSSLFEPLRPFSDRLVSLADFPTVAELCELDSPIVTFVEQVSASRRRKQLTLPPSYDAGIVEQRKVATRPRCWHDLFNVLVWCAFPRAKWALHTRQHRLVSAARAHAGPGEGRVRSAEGDALAMLDEGGAVLWADPSFHADVARTITTRDEDALSQHLESGRARAVLVGHALYEHLALGSRDVRASLVLLPPGPGSTVGDVDSALATMLDGGVPRDRNELGSAWIRTLEQAGC